MRSLVTALAFLLGTSICPATIIQLSVDTSLLIGHPAGPFYLEFQLTEGSGTNAAVNTVQLTGFDFSGGGPGADIFTSGNATGDLFSNVQLQSTQFFNQFVQRFDPGPQLSFSVSYTQFTDPGPQPDRFTFAILDCAFAELPTQGPGNALSGVNLTSGSTFETYAGAVNGSLGCDSSPGIGIPTPVVVPEPSAFWPVLACLTTVCLVISPRRPRSKLRAQ